MSLAFEENLKHSPSSVEGPSLAQELSSEAHDDHTEPPWLSLATCGEAASNPPVASAATRPKNPERRTSKIDTEALRLQIWRRVSALRRDEAQVTQAAEEREGTGEFYLCPQPRSTIPLQWGYVSNTAIPDELADRPCTDISMDELLKLLEPLFGTQWASRQPKGLIDTLQHLLSISRDFGELYGTFRLHKRYGDMTRLLPNMEMHRKQDEEIRRDAVRGDYITNARVRPRRIWDLHSNRVLPFVLPYTVFDRTQLWTVSHSWAPEGARTEVWTRINGLQWPVPLPRGTTLAHLRVELLNLGAAYVWLDVLCLRQRGRAADEDVRTREWALDVPTIGALYARGAPCVTYFNGLGLPLDASPDTLASPFHWLRRVWTVQEATVHWLPGGLTGAEAASSAAREFFHGHHARALPPADGEYPHALNWALRALRGRHAATALDALHSLAYFFRCATLPVYDARTGLDAAWARFLKHLYNFHRHQLALAHVAHFPESGALLPTWDEFTTYTLEDADAWVGRLHVLDRTRLGAPEPAVYWQEVDALGPLRVVRGEHGGEPGELKLVLSDGSSYTIHGKAGGTIHNDVQYRILKLSDKRWLVVEAVGQRMIDVADDSGKADDESTEARLAIEVVKSGCILLEERHEGLPQHEALTVLYHSGHPDDSRHSDQ